MKRVLVVTGALSLLAVLSGVALSANPAEEKNQKDIVDTAIEAGSFKTLVAALKQADLVKVLKGKGPFTVFAPTDEAFGKVEKDKLEALLKDKKALTGVLTYHVVPDQVLARDVVKLDSAKTVSGQPLKITARDGKVHINDAQVIKTDIICANGVIHVIDAVLLPPAGVAPARERIKQALHSADKLNDAAKRLACLQKAVSDVKQMSATNVLVQRTLQTSLDQSAIQPAETAAAVLRAGLRQTDAILAFKPRMEAKLPEGFPEPTPVGEIQLKSYPAYRLAQTSVSGARGEDRAFFTLFNHITQNRIAMTAPVEMRYEAGKDSKPVERSMAFLYGSVSIGKAGKEGEVKVMDVPAMKAVSLGLNGDYTPERIAEARTHLEGWLKRHAERYETAGALRVLGYNSPMVAAEQRYAEVQIPVRLRDASR